MTEWLRWPGCSCGMWVLQSSSCGMQPVGLVPWLKIEPGSPALGATCFSYWATREVPGLLFWVLKGKKKTRIKTKGMTWVNMRFVLNCHLGRQIPLQGGQSVDKHQICGLGAPSVFWCCHCTFLCCWRPTLVCSLQARTADQELVWGEKEWQSWERRLWREHAVCCCNMSGLFLRSWKTSPSIGRGRSLKWQLMFSLLPLHK